MSATPSEKKLHFSSPAGQLMCCKILEKQLPFGPHDYQLDGITSLLDGQDLLAVSATGSGKTAYVYMLMHVMLEILEYPEPFFHSEFPIDPAILVISPTTALEEDQVRIFNHNIFTLS